MADATHLSSPHRRALDLLAGCPAGCTESLMRAHGIKRDVIAKLVLDGLGIAEIERVMAGGKSVGVRRIKITEAGRVALER